MSTTGTQVERSARKQRQLLDAAERVYHRHGDLGLTVRRLAAEAEATSQTIYTYFGSRDAVIDGMYVRITAEVGGMLETIEDGLAADVDGSPVDALARAATVYRRYCVSYPARFAMLSGGHGPRGWDPTPMSELRQRLIAMIGRSVGDSSVGDGDEAGEAWSRLVLAVWHGVIQAQLDELLPAGYSDRDGRIGAGPGDEERVEQMMRALVECIVTPAPVSVAAPNGS